MSVKELINTVKPLYDESGQRYGVFLSNTEWETLITFINVDGLKSSEPQMDAHDEYTPPYQNCSKEEVVEQLNAALAEIDQTESVETAHAYMRGMGKQIAENNPW